METVERNFKASDERLTSLISGKREQLSVIIDAHKTISETISKKREGCRKVKKNLMACKELLQGKQDEIRRLYIKSIEHTEAISMLKQIEEVSKVKEKLKELLKEEHFLKATELLISSTELLEGKLCSVDALKDLSNELATFKKELQDVLILEMLHKYLYKSPKELFLQKCDLSQLPSYEEVFEHKHSVTFKLPTEGCKYDFTNTNYESMAEILHCISLLNTLPETVEVLKQDISQQLSCIVLNSSEVLCAILSNIKYTEREERDPRYLLNLLDVILLQFKHVAVNHYAFLDNLERIYVTKNLTNVSYGIADIYSKIQAAVEKFISEYMDLDNVGAQQAAAPVAAEVPPSTPTDISAYFLPKKVTQSKKPCLFKFDTSYGHNVKAYVLEEKGEHAPEESECSFIVCQPTTKNITIVYESLKKFISELETALKMESGAHCSLHSFVNDCVKMFLDQVSIDVIRSMEQTTNSLKAWQPVTNIEELISVEAKAQVLRAFSPRQIQKNKWFSRLPGHAIKILATFSSHNLTGHTQKLDLWIQREILKNHLKKFVSETNVYQSCLFRIYLQRIQ